jgi:5'-nucleotidase
MKILMTNDDGYDAGGLLVLEKMFSEAGHEVWVCAPDSQRSASSHRISIHSPVSIRNVGQRHFVCSGTPADCVLFFLGYHIMDTPDLVVSGINVGYNCGSDIIYSGTVAAAREAALHDIPSIAISLQDPQSSDDVLDFVPPSRFLLENLDSLYPLCNGASFLNINVPKVFRPGFKVSEIGKLDYQDNLVPVDRNDTDKITKNLKIANWVHPQVVDGNGRSDMELARQGWITVTPLMVFPGVDQKKMEALKKLSACCNPD